MSESGKLLNLHCPACGAPLKAKNSAEAITCVYCGSTVVPVAEAASALQAGGGVRVEGIKTSSSAIAYMELFFEEYDWEAFAYAQTLSIAEIDKLVDSLKISSADDKNTWLACFRAAAVPFGKKIALCRKILSSVIEAYKKDDLDAYSKFDAYKRITAMICVRQSGILSALEKYTSKAQKYGASTAEVSELNAQIGKLKEQAKLDLYSQIESIPEISAFIGEKNARIVARLAERGIDVEREYARATALFQQKRYVDALNTLLPIKGYSDVNALIEKLDKYYLLSDALEIEGTLYYFRKENDESETLALYPTRDGKIAEKPIIRNIGKMLTNHADILYYLDGNSRLKRYDLSAGAEVLLADKVFNRKSIHVYGRRVFLLASRSGSYNSAKFDLTVLDLTSGTVSVMLENIKSVVSLTGSKLAYTVSRKIQQGERTAIFKTATDIIDVDTMTAVEIGVQKVDIEGYVAGYVVYTQEAPNSYNKDLYVKALDGSAPERLIERNIYKFCGIIADKLFYYVGNSRNQSLINISCDGTERKAWPLYISDVLFEQGGWLYFIRRAGYNSVLCKSRLDGSQFSIIAADIERFVDLKNGYLYYINDASTLVKVRMDGSNLQKLCDDVETVLSVKDDKIIFVSVDDRISAVEGQQASRRSVKSIYAVDLSGGKIKLAYAIKHAKEYDENTVYYIAAKKSDQPNGQVGVRTDMLFRLDVESYTSDALLEIRHAEVKGGCYVATCVYGSYDCPQVWTLRRFRDTTLASTWYGRAFIHAYYAVSPTIVKWFGNARWFRKLWKGRLDKMVSRLQAGGVAATPYEDRSW